MLIPLMLLLQSSVLPSFDEVRARDCQKLTQTDPASAIVNASEWRQANGGIRADVCLAEAYTAQGNFAEASGIFKAAAQAATKAGDKSAAQYWAQAGNTAIAAGQAADAIGFLKEALNSSALNKPARANILIDRARAYVAIGQPENAEGDLTEVRRIAPDNPLGWLLSATLARRSGALSDAQNYIATAAGLSPVDAAIALEAGNIAAAAGALEIASEQWQQTIRIAPQSPQADSATKLLAALALYKSETSPVKKTSNAAKTEPAVATPQPQ
jgi:tetratricopeptide (TPR) repeat protein